jgi:hypothetical protein
MTDWQPIETAPKDGTRILFCGGESWPDLVRIGSYMDGHIWSGNIVQQPSGIPREWDDVADHWMPLPAAPKEPNP